MVIEGMAGAIKLQANSSSLTIASSELAALGSGSAAIAVRQIGDWAGSRPAVTTINLP